MARSRKRQRKPEQEHTQLTIRVECYEASVDVAVNSDVYAPQYAWSLDDDDLLYPIKTRLTLSGKSTYPEERVGEDYELSVYGGDKRSWDVDTTLKDVQARDDNGSPQYREYRGRQIPVYNPPNGLGLLEKVRGEARWRGWLFVAPRFVNEALILLSRRENLFLALHECKVDRKRWIRSLSLQTTEDE